MPRGRKSKNTETSVQRTVAPDLLVSLVKKSDECKTEMLSISGELGERVKHAIENGHLHRGAFGLVSRLYRMDEFRRNDFIRQFNLYCDICREKGLFGAEHVGDLVDTAEQKQEHPEPDIVAQNAEALEKGIKPLADDEKEFDDATSSKPSRRRAPSVGDAPATTRIQ